MTANIDALKWIHSHSSAQVAAVLPENLKATEGVEKVLERVMPAVSEDGKVPASAVTLTVDLMKDLGELSKDQKITPAQVIDDRFLR